MRGFVMALAMGLSACGTVQPFVADSARMPPGALGTYEDPDVAAVNLAQWAFADSGRTYGRPIEAARAAASMVYIAGQLQMNGRWANISALTREQLLEGRQEVRVALGVTPEATAQQLVDGLTGAGNALAAGDRVAAERLLNTPAFAGGGAQVLARLNNMPYLRLANVSTMRAANELFDSSSNSRY